MSTVNHPYADGGGVIVCGMTPAQMTAHGAALATAFGCSTVFAYSGDTFPAPWDFLPGWLQLTEVQKQPLEDAYYERVLTIEEAAAAAGIELGT